MGIGGSGMSAVAQIACSQGYQISGCDLLLNTPYISKIKNLPAGRQGLKFKIYQGHSADHLKNADILAVTPAVFYQNDDHPEIASGREKGILTKWQDFMGTCLHQDKYVICVAGTHGKSTTTALAGLLLEKAGLDPTVEVGATVKDWHNNVRLPAGKAGIGKSKYFVCEADEFHDNFAAYHSDIILLTLVEYDHPEYFGTIENMLACYQRFISRLKPGGVIIYNADSPLAHKLKFPRNSIPYRLSDFPESLTLSQPGNHNKSNALAIIKLAKFLKITDTDLGFVLKHFRGLERRLDFLGEKNGVKVYDDYANHPSSFSATLSAVRQIHPRSPVWAVIEPHTFTRLRVMLEQLPDAVKDADHIIVSKIFASREKDPGDFTGDDIVSAMHHKSAVYIPEFTDIVSHLKSHIQPGDVILVMGSGNSYRLSRQILSEI